MKNLATLALIALPLTASGTPYDGVFKQTANADCANVGAEGGALKIEEGIFFGVEVECRMTRPVNVVDMDATLYTMQCTGDDQVWSERALLMDAAESDGIIMMWNGYVFAYDRCSGGEN